MIQYCLCDCSYVAPVACKCPTKNQYAAIAYCSIETNIENSFCSSTLIILHSYCPLLPRVESGRLINGATEQLINTKKRKKKINDAK